MNGSHLFVIALVISAVLCWPLLRLLVRLEAIDRPNERSSHEHPTPRGGGLAILAAIMLPGAWVVIKDSSGDLAVVLLTALAVAAVSMIDDLRGLPPSARFGVHLAAALSVLAIVGIRNWQIALGPEGGWNLPVFLSSLLGVLWLAGYTSAFNFMDGINGIAGGQALATAAGMGLIAGIATGQWHVVPVQLCFIVAGASAGFLPHNFPRARMFMGDVGSAPLGLLLATLALWLAQEIGWWLLIPLALTHANFILDTGITLVWRIRRRENWRQPHRQHFYQQLIRAGRSHPFVTGWEMGLQALAIGLLVVYVLTDNAVARLLIAAVVIGIWLGFFAHAAWALRMAERRSTSK